jgi:hypothetical protein
MAISHGTMLPSGPSLSDRLPSGDDFDITAAGRRIFEMAHLTPWLRLSEVLRGSPRLSEALRGSPRLSEALSAGIWLSVSVSLPEGWTVWR